MREYRAPKIHHHHPAIVATDPNHQPAIVVTDQYDREYDLVDQEYLYCAFYILKWNYREVERAFNWRYRASHEHFDGITLLYVAGYIHERSSKLELDGGHWNDTAVMAEFPHMQDFVRRDF